jgi:hypothetical protein
MPYDMDFVFAFHILDISLSDCEFSSLSDLEPPTKYESHIVIRDSYDKAAATVSREQVEKLHKKHNKEDVLVIEKMQNGKLAVRSSLTCLCL